jgi:hypothetical protein
MVIRRLRPISKVVPDPSSVLKKNKSLTAILIRQYDNVEDFSKTFKKKKSLLRRYLPAGIAVGATAGLMGLIGEQVVEYQKENSGCFIIEEGKDKCKVVNLSCCNKNVTDNVKSCPSMEFHQHVCDDFDVKEGSCCKECDRRSIPGIKANQKVYCHKADVPEALNAITTKLLSSTGLFPSFERLKFFFILFMILIGILIAFKIKNSL